MMGPMEVFIQGQLSSSDKSLASQTLLQSTLPGMALSTLVLFNYGNPWLGHLRHIGFPVVTSRNFHESLAQLLAKSKDKLSLSALCLRPPTAPASPPVTAHRPG